MNEVSLQNDRTTGVPVRQLTNYFAHSYHLYFTNPGWWDGGRRLVFGSDRGNASNLYSIEIESGDITPITELGSSDSRQGWQNGCINPTRDELYSWRGKELWAIDLRTRKHRVLMTTPEGFGGGCEGISADGKYVTSSLMKRPDVGPVDLGAGYVGFNEIWAAKPLCRLVRVPSDGSNHEPQVLHEEHAWLGHVNPSSKLPHILTYCYEGPWTKVGQRMWGLDVNTGRTWKIRPQVPGEMMGHEYWLTDGETVGYHGKLADGQPVFGFVRYDDTNAVEIQFNYDSNHVHSNTKDLVVADGPAKGLSPYVVLCKFHDNKMIGPRVLCTHRGSRHTQHLHIHPRISPDNKYVLYTADPRGYGNLYTVALPEFDSLPLLSDLVKS
ncbi:MAG: PD40 domain-containing protein [Burkholderiales bacterium]|nr:PD40 domain-containing protein [Phycisphaerae bacterium]